MKGIVVFLGLVFLSGIIGLTAISFLRNIQEDIESRQDNRW